MAERDKRQRGDRRGEVVGGRFELIGRLGRRVQLARDGQTGASVAIRFIDLTGYDRRHPSDVRTRFDAIAEQLEALHHPNLTPVLACGYHEGAPFLATAHRDGHGLHDQLRAGALAFGRLVALLAPCLDGLERLHEAGLLHRDLKPATLLLCDPGTPRERLEIRDAGIAELKAWAAGGGTEALTWEMDVTPWHLSPECIMGGRITAASDIYQLGLVLIEAATGATAVDTSSALAAISAHRGGKLRIPPWLAGGEVGAVVARATARDPATRYRDAKAFAAALHALEADAIAAVEAAQRGAVTVAD